MIRFGSLFSGLGGLDLGLERAGWQCQWQVEHDIQCQAILNDHWPDMPGRWDDVRTFPPDPIEPWRVDAIVGGFPCQDISSANQTRTGRGGIADGARSGLWREFARILRVFQPPLAVIENVPALTIRGLDIVFGDLAALRYDAEWQTIPAAAFGLPHLRNRIFVVAHAQRIGRGREIFGPASAAMLSEEIAERELEVWHSARQAELGDGRRIRRVPNFEFYREVDGPADWLADTQPLCNAVVPHCGEFVGRCVNEWLSIGTEHDLV